jgi:hypothetical protein
MFCRENLARMIHEERIVILSASEASSGEAGPVSWTDALRAGILNETTAERLNGVVNLLRSG